MSATDELPPFPDVVDGDVSCPACHGRLRVAEPVYEYRHAEVDEDGRLFFVWSSEYSDGIGGEEVFECASCLQQYAPPVVEWDYA
jgi:hypothetical protein